MGNSVHPEGAAHRVCGWAAGVVETETRQTLNKFHRRENMVLVGRLAFT